MAAGWSCLRWRSRARLGSGRSLPCSCKLMGWKGVARLRVDSTGDIPGREQSRGQGGLRREASLRGRGGPRAAHTGDTPPLPESRRDCCPWPRGDRGGKKPGPSCFLAFVIGLRFCPFGRPTAKAKVDGLLASFSSVQWGDPSVPFSGGELKT